ncbi:hypothetical protein M0R19_06300 [Candidatus Pacearchaeota archaeon]|jgi:hypothetical protein|nr:hypothetical protein [Candidatus Pacearchaeota archaeon]
MRNKINKQSLTLKEVFQIKGWEHFLSVKEMAEKYNLQVSTLLARVRKGEEFDSITLYNFLLIREKDNGKSGDLE